uniref:Uncharacterized protein n=1 Tax=Vibrio phage P018-4 TaxID=3229728 RepID=A0AB39AJR9_9CAUD
MGTKYTLMHTHPKTGDLYKIDMEPMTRKEAETVKSKLMKPEEWTITKILD